MKDRDSDAAEQAQQEADHLRERQRDEEMVRDEPAPPPGLGYPTFEEWRSYGSSTTPTGTPMEQV